ncbi:MAG: glucosidase, partial [Gemmatimonadales bacterium]
MLPEKKRLEEDARRERNWKRWGPYLSERQWGTVREDYSEYGSCWEYFPHDHARSRAYRWGEDGLLGITDRECRLCFGLALWNGRDPILKERLFGLTGPEGNHGEDVKELYYYLESTPTHSYMKGLYKYPQDPFPYQWLVEENRRRGKHEPEFELVDTGVFNEERYFDVFAEYAKGSPNDILIRLTVANRGPEAATLHLLPTLWFRNTWSWSGTEERPEIRRGGTDGLVAEHRELGTYRFRAETVAGQAPPAYLFTDNDTNVERLYQSPNRQPWVKDAFHEYVIHQNRAAVNPAERGTKAAAHYVLEVPAGGEVRVRLRLTAADEDTGAGLGPEFDETFTGRLAEADAFYAERIPAAATVDEAAILRQAWGGLLWSKQYYNYVIRDWLKGDPAQPAPPPARLHGRNSEWTHLYNRDVLSMPDKWEYPWYAAWDMAFHMLPFAQVDTQFAKEQLVLMLREWYMHPNGQIPAYEFAFGDVNPPVHAWACWRVYKMSGPRGQRDRVFLARVFQKLLLNFTWWVNRKDIEGNNLFAGGFLGLDNIGVFDRSRPLPTGGHLEQADGTAWMAFYCATMLSMALELADGDPAYEDMASKFFEHFVAIADAMNTLGGDGLWDENDGFYYDQLHVDGTKTPLRVRSLVGVVPLFACELLDQSMLERLPGFAKRLNWFVENRPDLANHITFCHCLGEGYQLLAIPSRERLERVLQYVLDENEFLSPYGVRSVSRFHRDHPYIFRANGEEFRVDYVP